MRRFFNMIEIVFLVIVGTFCLAALFSALVTLMIRLLNFIERTL